MACVPGATCQFQDHMTSGSVKEDFLMYLQYMGTAVSLVMCFGPLL